MEIPVIYLLKVSLCLTILYVVYLVFLSATTFFIANRFYLVGSLLFSFVAPALDLRSAGDELEMLSSHPVATSFHSQINEFIPAEETVRASGAIGDASLLPAIYYAGVIIILLRTGYAVIRVLQIRRRSEPVSGGRFKIYRSDLHQPFSFFNLIFLPDGKIDPMIVGHEQVHARQLHTIDLLIAEAATALLWFNPLMILYRRSLKIQHEYLADAGAIGNRPVIERYLMLLWNQMHVKDTSGAISHFYSKSIKNRIIMITRNKTSKGFYSIYLLIVPVICALLFAFSNKPGLSIEHHASAGNEVVIVVDPGHGGTDDGSKTSSGLTEKQLTLSIAREIQSAGSAKDLRVILTRGDDASITLQERTTASEKHDASLFLSIHVNHDSDVSKSGIVCMISERNAAYEQSRKFSDQVMSELGLVKGIRVNGIVKSDFYVLKNNSVPAVALELGYLSNAGDQMFISKESSQKAIADRIVSAIVKHLKK